MSPTLLELVVALVLLWVAWKIGLALGPWVIVYFRRTMRGTPPPPQVAASDPATRAQAAFRSAQNPPPNANDP